MPSSRKIAILGSTGSIGRSALEVIGASGGRLRAIALSANSSLPLAVEQARLHRPRWLIATDAQRARQFDFSGLPAETELLTGDDGLARAVSDSEVDVVLSAIVGSAGLRGTWGALEAGKTVA